MERRRLKPHEQHNRRFWDDDADDYQAAHGGQLEGAPLAWGAWRMPESELQVLGDVRGRDVLEFGCGGAQWSVALAAQGARCVGLDLSRGQLRHAARNVQSAGVDVALAGAGGEAPPFSTGAFDIVFCDHGAMSFCDPSITVGEASRLLRPGGMFAFCAST